MRRVEDSETYQTGTGSIHLTVTIGEGQFGSSRVRLNDVIVDRMRHTFDGNVGTAAECRGKKLTIVSVVTDVRPQTNRTSVTYELTGGAGTFKKTLAEIVSTDETIIYAMKVDLT